MIQYYTFDGNAAWQTLDVGVKKNDFETREKIMKQIWPALFQETEEPISYRLKILPLSDAIKGAWKRPTKFW